MADLRARLGRVPDRKEPDSQDPDPRDTGFRDAERALLLAIARAQGAVLRGEPSEEALAPLFAVLKDLTGSRAVRAGADGSLDFESPASPLPPGLLAEARSAITGVLASDARRVELCEARQRADRAEFADLAKTEFLATMSHELRTPLNAILGFSELLKNQTFGPLGSARYVGYASDIFDSGKLLLQIISDIMDVAKVETGRIHLAQDWVDADHLVSSVVRLIEPRAAAAGIAFETRVAQEPLPRLWADERLIKQALLNILSNAVKFTPPGGSIRLTVDTIRLDSGDTGLGIEIADTGLGIAASELGRVFEPFHRGDCATNRRFEGTGLGLPLARSFIDLHGGSLTLDSVQGAGTTVRISLPPTAGNKPGPAGEPASALREEPGDRLRRRPDMPLQDRRGPGRVALPGGLQHGAMVLLGHVLRPLGGEVETQVAVERGELRLDQRQQLGMSGADIERHVEAPVELTHAGRVGLAVHVPDQVAGPAEILLLQLRNRQFQRRRLQRQTDRVGIRRVRGGDLRHHGAPVRHEIDQRLGFELAQGLTDRHSADLEGIRQVLLPQGRASRQPAGQDGRAQRRLDEPGRGAVSRRRIGDQFGQTGRSGRTVQGHPISTC